MLARVKSGNVPGDPVFLSAEEFEKQFVRTVGDRTYIVQQDAIWWAKNGRLGSHWQIGQDMYVKVREAGDDPFQYYSPPQEKHTVSGLTSWTNYSGGRSSGGCASSGGCGGGCSSC